MEAPKGAPKASRDRASSSCSSGTGADPSRRDGGAQLALPPRAQAWRPRKRASWDTPRVRHLPGCGIPDELRLKRYPCAATLPQHDRLPHSGRSDDGSSTARCRQHLLRCQPVGVVDCRSPAAALALPLAPSQLAAPAVTAPARRHQPKPLQEDSRGGALRPHSLPPPHCSRLPSRPRRCQPRPICPTRISTRISVSSGRAGTL